MTINSVSMNSTTNVYAASSSNTSASQQQNQATAGVAINTMDALLANVGQQLGLTPAQIDAGQAIMHAAFGDYAGAAQNCLEAANNLLTQQSPIDQGYIANTQANLADSGSQTALDTIRNANNTQQCADETNGNKGKAKNFFEAMAEALGKIMGDKMADMYKSMKALENAGGSTSGNVTTGSTDNGTSTATAGNTAGSGTPEDAKKNETGAASTASTATAAEEQKARDFGIAQSKFSADAQMFSMISNLVNTTIKTVGEALSTVARKG